MFPNGHSVEVTREFSAERINYILNDPDVRPWVAPTSAGTIDVSVAVNNRANILLMGEHGGCLLVSLVPGVYEVHTQVLRSGRGQWTADFLETAKHWMFTKTDCFEVLTRVPHGHVRAKMATLAAHMRHAFTRPEGSFRDRTVPVDVYSLTIQDWAETAKRLVEHGQWLHSFFHEHADRLGITTPLHDDDENHNRYAGAALDMAVGGQIRKAVIFYNRWALASRHAPIQLVSENPPVIKFDIGYLTLRNGELEMVTQWAA